MGRFQINYSLINCKLNLEDDFGEFYYCYIICDSLTKIEQSMILFSSNELEGSLNLLFWEKSIVLDSGSRLYLLDKDLSVINSIKYNSFLIGIHLFANQKLLILEEDGFRVVDKTFNLIKQELFDLIEDYSINNSKLYIKTKSEQVEFQM